MSIYPSARAWDHSRQRGAKFTLLLAMADRADELGVLYAGYKFLAGRARMKERQAKRHIQELVRSGEVIAVRSRRADGLNLPNYYIVAVGAPDEVLRQAMERVEELLALRGGVVLGGSGENDTTAVLGGSGENDTIVVAKTPPYRRVAKMTPDPLDPEERHSEEGDGLKLWQAALAELEGQMAKATFRKHLAGTSAAGQGDELVVRVRNEMSREWLEAKLADVVTRTVASVANRPLAVRFEVGQ